MCCLFLPQFSLFSFACGGVGVGGTGVDGESTTGIFSTTMLSRSPRIQPLSQKVETLYHVPSCEKLLACTQTGQPYFTPFTTRKFLPGPLLTLALSTTTVAVGTLISAHPKARIASREKRNGYYHPVLACFIHVKSSLFLPFCLPERHPTTHQPFG